MDTLVVPETTDLRWWWWQWWWWWWKGRWWWWWQTAGWPCGGGSTLSKGCMTEVHRVVHHEASKGLITEADCPSWNEQRPHDSRPQCGPPPRSEQRSHDRSRLSIMKRAKAAWQRSTMSSTTKPPRSEQRSHQSEQRSHQSSWLSIMKRAKVLGTSRGLGLLVIRLYIVYTNAVTWFGSHLVESMALLLLSNHYHPLGHVHVFFS